jgi:hypothetical protein
MMSIYAFKTIKVIETNANFVKNFCDKFVLILQTCLFLGAVDLLW